jgi:Uma2 family endonuclease
VALVVEIETAATRRYDEVLKPTLYAEAGIRDYWRVEPGPVLHVYELEAGRFRLRACVEGAEQIRLDAPYPVRITPSAWR